MNADPRPPFDPAAVRESLSATGYCVLPALFDAPTMARLSDEMDEASRREEEIHGRETLRSLGQTGYITDVLAIGPAMRRVLGAPETRALVDGLLDRDARLCVAQGIVLNPGEGRGAWPRRWHADFYPGVEAVGDPTFRIAVNCLLAVDDMTLDNGATGVIPGSHRLLGDPAGLAGSLEALEVRVPVPAGSVVVLDGGVWHCAGFNRSDRPRRVVKMLFGRSWVRPKLDYGAMWRRAVWADAPDDLPHLLGVGLERT